MGELTLYSRIGRAFHRHEGQGRPTTATSRAPGPLEAARSGNRVDLVGAHISIVMGTVRLGGLQQPHKIADEAGVVWTTPFAGKQGNFSVTFGSNLVDMSVVLQRSPSSGQKCVSSLSPVMRMRSALKTMKDA